MMTLPVININGGARTFYEVRALIEEISEERHWRNLWLKKTKKITVRIFKESIPDEKFENVIGNKINFPHNVIIHDFAGNIKNVVGGIMRLEIGYANQHQQYWFGVRTFSGSLWLDDEKIDLF